MKLVVVESPAKAKTINKYLGSDYEVVASFGHVRDLPSKDGSVKPDNDFEMLWDMEPKAAKRVADIAKLAEKADSIILATDPDREGEAISWHLLEILRSKKALKSKDYKRVAFNAITKESIQEAMRNPRDLDQALVDAYLARRALDYLVGFNISPVLWRKLPGARSAGRVQSVALRLVCDREQEIEAFKSQEYWSIAASLLTPSGETFDARVVAENEKKISRLDIHTEPDARRIEATLKGASLIVTEIETKPVKRNPAAPFTTSTLQQEASRKLGYAPARTMQLAQKLYEGVELGGETTGLITYMRTDGVQMDAAAVSAVRNEVEKRFGQKALPQSPRMYKTKAKNAQVSKLIDREMAALYELIWKRTMASQMEAAEMERTTAEIEAKKGSDIIGLRATGTVTVSPGFMALYDEDRDDGEDEDARRLPKIVKGDKPKLQEITTSQHFTEPPPRFTEASLVKRMEELGIGRPSTYASTLAVLRDRGYVLLDKKRLVPEDKGRLVTSFLQSFFTRYVQYDFTANLEEQLDRISNNEIDWKEVLRDFWQAFSASIDETKELRITTVLDALSEALESYIFPAKADGTDPRVCPSCGKGTLSLKLGKYGAFTGCSNYPECKHTGQLGGASNGAASEDNPLVSGNMSLGFDPETGLEVTVRDGRFGPYVQLGEGEKPKRQSLPKGFTPGTVTLEVALQLLALPREVGLHPEDGEPILANIGRYGPYLQHHNKYAKLETAEDVLTIGLNRAVDLFAQAALKGSGGRFERASTPGREVGLHPADNKPIVLKSGRFGPYVQHGKILASLPKSVDAESLSLEEAIALIEKKAGSSTPAKTKAKSAKPSAKAKPKATKSPPKKKT
jgi:DNA topoisomerase I